MCCRAKTIGEVLHHSGDARTPPPCGEDVVTEQKAQSVAYIKADNRDPRAIGDTCPPGKGPRAKAGHKGAKPGDQPGNPAATTKILRCSAVETHDIEPDAQIGRAHV